MAPHQTLATADVSGKRVLVRVDLNVPFEKGRITDATRIERILPTLKFLIKKQAIVILLAHFDRPKGQVVPHMSLAPVAKEVEKLLGQPVTFIATDWKSKPHITAKSGDVVLLENTRFSAGEEKNDPEFAKLLASLGDFFVNDAFSAAHRAHASTEAIAHLLPSMAGLGMQAELDALEKALGTPKRPVAALVGGSKVSTKLDLLGNLVTKVDSLIIGGAMANTFMLAQGFEVGKSLVEPAMTKTAEAILIAADKANCAVFLPQDVIVAEALAPNTRSHDYGADNVPHHGIIADVGDKSIEHYKAVIDDCHTLLWNGPLGAFEISPFDRATTLLARHAAARTKAGKLISVAGGGDTVSALNHAGVAHDFTYISTAGGAFLEWLEGKTLPGVKALQQNNQ